MGNLCSCLQGLEQTLSQQGGGFPSLQTGATGGAFFQGPRFVTSLEKSAGENPTSPPPPSQPPPADSGKKRALLIGINYFGTPAELAGCLNDVENVERLLLDTCGWRNRSGPGPRPEIRKLTDANYNSTFSPKNTSSSPNTGTLLAPTRANILSGLQWLVADAKEGDTLFLLYSGHGAQEPDPNGFEEDGMNDTILPCDFDLNGMISDDILTQLSVRPLPEGCSLTAVIDACHSGTALDLPWTWLPERRLWKEDWNPFFTRGDVCMLAGCLDRQTSSDGGRDLYGRRGGALTTAFCEVLSSERGGIRYDELMDELLVSMRRNGFSQTPQLSSSQAFAHENRRFAPFIFGAESAGKSSSQKICGNLNVDPSYGLVFRRRFPPQPAPATGSPLEGMLADLGMLFAGEELMDAGFAAFDVADGIGDVLDTAADDVVDGIADLF
eukprot:CAMPEP_0179000010 /NCGR_PEP_ID=MMETSP0795-20121207/10416_1 /TAXON_ID=88552 /ORGANISM="Amoebophrya sp., Strain Ameob2" /LENGTH=439 /DNA_ID=CAMNT_0020692923 /DNA_START=44 /DNA_END=1363 /DNA_ORIENTATION=+